MRPKRYIIPVFVPHLGCPNDCVFCNQKRISGACQPATAETVKLAVERAREYMPKDAPGEIAFYGGSFTAIPVEQQLELLSAAGEFLRENPENSLRLSTRPDCIEDTVLERLWKCGVKTIELGSQSMDDEVLRLSGRGHTSEDTVKAAGLVKKWGFGLILQMMTGLPGDTYEKCLETGRKIAELEPNGVRIYPTVVVKDTALLDMWRDGKYKEHTVDEAVLWCCGLVRIFEEKNIPIIRLGLNPTEELSSGAAVGGAYHPAFGELVYSRLMLERVEEKLKKLSTNGKFEFSQIVLGVNGSCVSMMAGQKRRNIIALQEEFGIKSLRIIKDNIKWRDVNILSIAK